MSFVTWKLKNWFNDWRYVKRNLHAGAPRYRVYEEYTEHGIHLHIADTKKWDYVEYVTGSNTYHSTTLGGGVCCGENKEEVRKFIVRGRSNLQKKADRLNRSEYTEEKIKLRRDNSKRYKLHTYETSNAIQLFVSDNNTWHNVESDERVPDGCFYVKLTRPNEDSSIQEINDICLDEAQGKILKTIARLNEIDGAEEAEIIKKAIEKDEKVELEADKTDILYYEDRLKVAARLVLYALAMVALMGIISCIPAFLATSVGMFLVANGYTIAALAVFVVIVVFLRYAICWG